MSRIDKIFMGQDVELYFRPAHHDELALILQFLKDAALWLIEDYCLQLGKAYLRLDCGKHVARLCQYYEAYGFHSAGETMVQGESLTLYEKRIADISS